MMDDVNKATHVVYINCAYTLHYSFASHLSMEFHRKGINSFVDCNGVLDVIEGASSSVVVFSKNCLSSTSCLDKLVRVHQCWRKNGQLVVPVFYDVSPSDVVVPPQHKSADRRMEWSSALRELRELPGHQSREECTECELVEEIVKDVYEKLYPTESVGIDAKLLEIELLLRKQTWGIRSIGIWGMPGIGKTTLAKALFDQISEGYEASCFIKHFDRELLEKGIHRLFRERFGKIPKELPSVGSSITTPSLPRDKLSKKRTLLVLDDVHNPFAAESFLRGFHWFSPGSLIIITSRDKLTFRLCQISHVYEVQSLNDHEALQLFSQSAFGKDIRGQNLLDLSKEVIDYANGNPLALRFYGRELKGKKLSEMQTTFLKLKLRTPYKIHDLFNSSYETLNKNQKNIFLDIACFFKGDNVDYVMQLLEGCGFFPHVGIDVLVEKCLVTIAQKRVKMHSLIQDFGREIINGETVQIERRRRLWEPWTIKFLLEDDELKTNEDQKATYTRALGTENIEGIFMDTSNLNFDVKPGAFENMVNLRILKIYCPRYAKRYGLRLPKGLESLPYELRLLHWENYPLKSLPQEFDPCHLIELNMPYSQLHKLWEGTKNLEKLKMVRLCHSRQLTEIDDICKAQNVELIDLQGCTKLQSFPAMCQLQHLRVVNLSGCREIKSFPEVSPNIEELHLQGTGIRELPISLVTLSQQAKLNRELSNLLTEYSGVSDALNVERVTSLIKNNSSNQHLNKLVCLNMKDCSHLGSLPHMVDLESLKVLNMSGCSGLEHIQGFPRNLKELYLAGTAIKELPPLPQSLEVLNAHGCVLLKSIPSGFKRLPNYCAFSNCFSLSAEVVSEYLKNALAYVGYTAREYQQEPNKSLPFSLSVSSPAKDNSTFHLQPGYSVLIRMSPSWRSTLVAFAILVEAAFLDDYQKATAFGFKCVCRWKDKEGLSRRIEKTFHCWTLGGGVQKFQKEHMFVFCDLNFHPSTSTGKDPDILADLIVLEIFPVNTLMELIDESCTVTRCGVYVITSAYGDASLTTNLQPVLSLDCPKMLSDDEVEEALKGLEEKDRFLFLYIACLVNDEEANFVAPRIASIGLGISSGFKVLADNSLICISTDGVIKQSYLRETMGREIVRRQCMQPDILKSKHTPSIHSGELGGIEDHVAGMISLSSSKSVEVKTVGIWGPSREGEAIYSSMVEPVEPPHGFREQGKDNYMMWQKLFEIGTKYLPIKPIGRGSADNVVCSAINRVTTKKVAIKKIPNVFKKRIHAVNTLKEMNFLRHVRHDNIIALNDVMLSGQRTNFKDVYMVYELMDTDLHQIIKSSQSLSDDYCKYFLFQLLRGLEYLHSVKILHCDLKPGNILVNANCNLKISDFGLARNICNDQFKTEYLAPELLLGCGNYGTSIDIWSVGCIFAELLGRKPIFPGTAQNQLNLIINILGSQHESDLQFINNPKTRESINSLKFSRGTHFSNLYPEANPLAIDLLQRMLVFDPTKRITVIEALLHPYMAELFNSKPNPPARAPNTLDIDENMEEHTLREMLWNEMLYYHPEATASQKPSKFLMSS
ncbi:PREDICTED: disease resistance protein RRS1-like [Camelina sativa]|uniref:Disease resistance protein RRS1-like n=1 Tax=Camelina sativa TaxID=90675 RepID=A0ABM0U861_CAMSA|nr:PREDICTED: disease resistance protein RRS1-like [Camelina sativa]